MRALACHLMLAACLAAPLAGAQTVDPATVPASKVALPAFPFVQLPKESPKANHERDVNWDRVYVVAGSRMLPVEGRFKIRTFSVDSAGLTPEAVLKHYQREIGALGGVKVATVKQGETALLPAGDTERRRAFEKLGHIGTSDALEQYLIRAPSGNVWISVAVFDDGLNGSVVVVHEQPFKPSVSLLKAQQ